MYLLKYIADKLDEKDSVINFYKIYLSNNIVRAYNLVLNGNFFMESQREKNLNYFIKIKKIYNSLSYFARLYKWKTYKHFLNEHDLYGNLLSDFPDEQVIKIMQNKTIYSFRLTDLLNIWNIALTHSVYIMPKPTLPNNPFTNIKFTISNMVNIFIKTKYTHFSIPLSIDIFWRCLMNKKKFKIEAHGYLKELAIKNYIKSDDIEVLYLDIISMVNDLSGHINNKRIDFSNNYENKKITVSALKPQLKTYLLYSNTYNVLKKRIYFRSTVKEIKKFFFHNPCFGRRRVVPNRNTFHNTILSPINSISSNYSTTNNSENDNSEFDEISNSSDSDSSDNNYAIQQADSEEIESEEIETESIS
tara:strand:+ start:314 stop:1393 length:1080 start_codon:yes stop_codon:yes gene_type:complete